MKKDVVIALGAASMACVSIARAQTTTQPAPQQSQPAQQSQTVVTQPAQQAPPTVVTPAQPAPAVVTPQPQTTVVVPGERERATTGGPNPTLFTSGLLTFGVPYGISVVVAAESDRDGDKNLFVPVVGPWMAYANEGTCNNQSSVSCGRTTGNKVLLAADGIFQAIGAIELVAAFSMPATTTVARVPGTTVAVAPSRLGPSAYGVAAAGSF